MNDLKVVNFPNPNLTDIPAMLRRLADQIEAGDWDKVETAFLLLPRPNNFPELLGWGDVQGKNDPLIQLELAKHWLCKNLVQR